MIVNSCRAGVGFVLVALSLAVTHVMAQATDAPKPVPTSRAEMLKALNALKRRQPRLPMPAEEEPPAAPSAPAASGSPGSLGVVNNGRMRNHYLPTELQTRGGQPPINGAPNNHQLPYDFSTELFWIVSRVNNCHYCLGHQESKLAAVGVSEGTLLALDSDWSTFTEKQRAAFGFTRQLTLAPYSITDKDIDTLRLHFTDPEILEIAFLVGRYNSTNRWTDSLGIPQEDHRDYLSSLDREETEITSKVVVHGFPKRKAFDDYKTWRSEFEKQASRTQRLNVTTSAASTKPAHESLLLSIPAAGEVWVAQLSASEHAGVLNQMLRHKIAYVAARCDHAWYMQHVSRSRLLADGMTEQAIFSLVDSAHDRSTELLDKTKDTSTSVHADAAALAFVAKLTEQPQSMTDADIEGLSKFFTPHEIAEIVYHTGLAALLNRVTEVAQLGWANQ